ncbi:MAG: CotH kinase family protein, partial [Bacteroidota bacterium]|nr:CotH kinase family protein [Bacteroidota bacterium]
MDLSFFIKLRSFFLLISVVLLNYNITAQVLINEYSAANYDGFQDNYGEYEDWIELYNGSNSSVDLNGWFLTDKINNLTKWTFPSSFTIPANSVALVYCSGRDEISGGNAHTNFKITQTKANEVIILSNNLGVLQDSIRVYPNLNSHSRGRSSNGNNLWSVFVSPTPGLNNLNPQQEYASTPVFSQVGGYYNSPVNLTLSSPDPNITIYYTTNGDLPNNTSFLYSSPITINSTTVVKAVAYSSNPNIPASFIEYHTFFINDTHTIPILSISGNEVDDLLNGGWGSTSLEPKGTIEWFDKNGFLIDKGMGEFNKHGNDSWAYDQRGFDYIMRDQFGYNHALKDKLFVTKDRDKFQRIIVKAAANDNFSFEDGAHIRDAYVHHLSQLSDLRMDERSVAFCIVYRNGEYWGVYDLREKADDHDFTDYYYDQNKNNIQFLKTWGGTWAEYGGVQAETDWDNFKNYVLSNPMNIQANYNTVKSQFNTGSLIDYFLLNSYVVCSDWLNWNTAWWRGMDQNGDKKKWRYVLWDMDATFDHYINYTNVPSTSPNADPCDPSSLNDPGGQGHVPIWNALLNNDEFFDDYLNRWQDLANSHLSCQNMILLLDSMISIIDPEMPRQISTWGGGSYADWQQNVQDLRDFINQRCVAMNNGFVPCYQPQISGPYDVTVEIIGVGEVEMSKNNFINDITTPWLDSRFGGVSLPFEVISGNFQNWEVLPAGVYTYDPLVDTLILDLQGNVTVRANFIPPVPTRNIVYDIDPAGTNSSITINGNIINTFPYLDNYIKGDTINLLPNIDPLYTFSSWSSDSNSFVNGINNPVNLFYAESYDTIMLRINLLPTTTAFISGNDTICSNGKTNNWKEKAQVKFDFSGDPPFTFSYSIDGILQSPITTVDNIYILETTTSGLYELVDFYTPVETGIISGSALVTVFDPPIANFNPQPDTMKTD